MSEQELTRRERLRTQTVAEIKAAAMAQVYEGGTEAVSLNAIARSMAMSTPALYRYFDSRDELLAELAADIHLALAEALEAAATQGTSPAARVRAVANAYRDWALAQPNAYRLAYESTHGSGVDHAADRTKPAAQRSMNALLGVVAEACEPPVAPIAAALDKQIRRWNGGNGQDSGDRRGLRARVLYSGLVWWWRLHGLISLELGRHLVATGIDPALLYRAEIEAMLGRLTA
jgi:AcrR family transcriptional regulator